MPCPEPSAEFVAEVRAGLLPPATFVYVANQERHCSAVLRMEEKNERD